MPIFKSGESSVPSWSQIRYFEILTLNQNEKQVLNCIYPKEIFTIVRGECLLHTNNPVWLCHNGYDPSFGRIVTGEQHVRSDPYDDISITHNNMQIKSDAAVLVKGHSGDEIELTAIWDNTTIVRICGDWSEHYGGVSTFVMLPEEKPANTGDPDLPNYLRNTCCDNHYHDFDEYWIIVDGSGTVISENKAYEVAPGDCIATGMGFHHYFSYLKSPVKCVYFEGIKEGEKRSGHLYNYKDGQAQPKTERI